MEAHRHWQRCDPKPPSSLTHPVTWTLDTHVPPLCCVGGGVGGIVFQAAKKKLLGGGFIGQLDAPTLRALLALPGVDASRLKVGPPPRTHATRGRPPPQFLAAAEHGLLVMADLAPLSLPGGASSTPRSVRFVCEPRLWPYLRERWEFGIGVTHFRDHAAAADPIGAFVRGPCSVPCGPAACGGICD